MSASEHIDFRPVPRWQSKLATVLAPVSGGFLALWLTYGSRWQLVVALLLWALNRAIRGDELGSAVLRLGTEVERFVDAIAVWRERS